MADNLLDLQVGHYRKISADCLVNKLLVLEVFLPVEELEIHKCLLQVQLLYEGCPQSYIAIPGHKLILKACPERIWAHHPDSLLLQQACFPL
jgi:hypothetical protein